MTVDPAQEFQKVFAALKDYGLLLVSDRAFPSVGGLIAGSTIKGSWWSHPLAHTIFGVNEVLEDHKDVLIAKLIDGKVTFVYRTIWPDVFAVATANERWQTDDLSTAAKSLFEQLQKKERLDTSKLRQVQGRKLGDVTRELERRLLVRTEQVHTSSGAHAKIIETWDQWADRVGLKDRGREPKSAKRSLEKRVKKLNEKFNSNARLPWPESLKT
jgi:hypothetical protein